MPCLFKGKSFALEVEAGGGTEFLDNGFDDWKTYYVEITERMGPRRAVYGSFRRTERFSLGDNEAVAGVYYPFSERAGVHSEAAVSPSYNILPKFSFLGEFEFKLADGLIFHPGLKATEYADASVLLGIFTIELYIINYRAGYTFYPSHLPGAATETGHRFQADYYYGGRNKAGLSYAFGKEAERVGRDRVVVTEVEAVSLTGVHWFLERWGLSYEIGVHEQGELYTRKGARVGVRRLF